MAFRSVHLNSCEAENMDASNILIVDDEQNVRSSVKRALHDEPYHVYLAGSGEEALKILSEHPFKVILSDVNMPEMDGFELLEKVKEAYPDIISVIFSGLSEVQLILDIVNARQIERYLTKPWNTEDLKITIKQCIELFDLRKEVTDLRKKKNDGP